MEEQAMVLKKILTKFLHDRHTEPFISRYRSIKDKMDKLFTDKQYLSGENAKVLNLAETACIYLYTKEA